MSTIELNSSSYETESYRELERLKQNAEKNEQSTSERVSRWAKVIFPLAAIGALATLNLRVPTKLIAAPIVAKAAQVLVDSAQPLTQAMVRSIVNLKNFFQKPLKVTVPTMLAAGL